MTRVADLVFAAKGEKVGGARFDGAADYGEVPPARSLSLGEGTLLVEFIQDKDASASDQTIVSFDCADPLANGRFTLSVVKDGSIRVCHKSKDRLVVLQGGTVNRGKGCRVAYAWGPDGSVLFLNGYQVDTSPAALVLAGDEEPMVIGASQIASQTGTADPLSHFFAGAIARVQVFDEDIGTATVFPGLVAGTLIRTPKGDVPIEDLRPGDLVATIDAGVQPVRWSHRVTHGAAALEAAPDLRPVEIAAGALDNDRPLKLAPGAMILPDDEGPQVLIAARELVEYVGGDFTMSEAAGPVTYVHLMFDQHHVLLANGATVASLYRPEAAQAMAEQIPHDDALQRIRHKGTAGIETPCRPALSGAAAHSLLTGASDQGQAQDELSA